jgi:hypothetical protein
LLQKAPNCFTNAENCRQLLFIFTFSELKELTFDIVMCILN